MLVIGFLVMKLVLNVKRLAPAPGQSTAQVSPSASPVSPAPQASQGNVAAAPSVAATVSPPPTVAPAAVAGVSAGAPEVRRAKPVTREDLARAQETPNSSSAESGNQNRVAIRPLKRTYVRVTVGERMRIPPSSVGFRRRTAPLNFAVSMCRFVFLILRPLRSRKTARRWKRAIKT